MHPLYTLNPRTSCRCSLTRKASTLVAIDEWSQPSDVLLLVIGLWLCKCFYIGCIVVEDAVSDSEIRETARLPLLQSIFDPCVLVSCFRESINKTWS